MSVKVGVSATFKPTRPNIFYVTFDSFQKEPHSNYPKFNMKAVATNQSIKPEDKNHRNKLRQLHRRYLILDSNFLRKSQSFGNLYQCNVKIISFHHARCNIITYIVLWLTRRIVHTVRAKMSVTLLCFCFWYSIFTMKVTILILFSYDFFLLTATSWLITRGFHFLPCIELVYFIWNRYEKLLNMCDVIAFIAVINAVISVYFIGSTCGILC